MLPLNNRDIKVNPVNHTIQTLAILFCLAGPASVLAEAQPTAETPAAESGGEAATTALSDTPRPMGGMGMRHKCKSRHSEGPGGMKHAGCQHGKGQGKHGACKHGKGQHDKHDQVVQRLERIETRLAKIEAMLEILMQR